MKRQVLVADPVLEALGVQLTDADECFNNAWEKYFRALPLLKPERFWQMLELFLAEIKSRMWHNGVEEACREFMRQAVSRNATYTLDEAVLFARTYGGHVSHLCNKRFGRLFEYAGDSLNDLMDSLPLVGREVLTWRVRSPQELHTRVTTHFKDDPDVARLIYGENYIGMNLANQARMYWLLKNSEK
jgi:hypothetical protein